LLRLSNFQSMPCTPHLFGMPLCSKSGQLLPHSNTGWPCAVGPPTTSLSMCNAIL
jgi:hypothetical protein